MNPIIWRVEHFEEIDSTNSWLVARALEGADEGLVAVADFQTRGRGRLDRRWEASPGSSLLCSLLLRPALDGADLQSAVACVALGARAALVRLSGVRPQVKWPNDLMVGDAKIAGLLAELVDKPRLGIVIGIGINLTPTEQAPEGATSIWHEAGVTITPRALLDILLEEVEMRRVLLDSFEGRDVLRQEFAASLSTIGQTVKVIGPLGEVSGVATGVDAAGRLIVEHDGTQSVFGVGDVIHVRRDDGGQR